MRRNKWLFFLKSFIQIALKNTQFRFFFFSNVSLLVSFDTLKLFPHLCLILVLTFYFASRKEVNIQSRIIFLGLGQTDYFYLWDYCRNFFKLYLGIFFPWICI